MQRYVGTKQLNAEPMNKLMYNQLRGWDMPTDEKPDDEGYLVEYVNGGKPNHPDYEGYISWSPKDVFEASYDVLRSNVSSGRIDTLMSALTYQFAKVGAKTTVCCSFLPDGFQVATGESACVDPANYQQELGEKYAKERCEAASLNKLWELEGYLLRHFRNVG